MMLKVGAQEKGLSVTQIARIIHAVPSIAEEASGPSYSVVRLCETLQKNNQFEVSLASLSDKSIARVTAGNGGFSHEIFPFSAGLKKLSRSKEMHRWLVHEARSASNLVIHSHGLWLMPNVYPGWVAHKYDIPLVVSPRGTMSEWAMRSGSSAKKIFWPLVQKPSLKATSCFHATAYSEYEDIRRLGFTQPVAIIPNGIDIPEIACRASDEIHTLLFLGRVHPKKGVDILLSAWQRIQQGFPGWRLRIVGPDNMGYLAEMRRLSAQFDLERVEFSGGVYGDEKWRAYAAADLFVLPTHSENFGLAVAEALASGCPAIVSKGAPWGGLETHDAGWWVDIGVDPLVKCLEKALALTTDERFSMGQRGKEWMKREYSWPCVAEQMELTYQWILGRAAKPDCVLEY
jgi:glycosyltransferase involved in cell wall biosynthesis